MMNEGILFYWLAWICWLVVTFFMKKGASRTTIGLLLLVGIILSGHSISFTFGTVNAAFILCLLIGFIQAARNHQYLSHHLIGSFSVAITYVSMQLFALYDPVKLIVDKKYILMVVLLIELFLFIQKQNTIIPVYFIGMVIGDILFQLLIYRLQGYIEVGSNYVLDLFASTLFIIFTVNSAMETLRKMKKVSYKKSSTAKQIY
jgi:hypothetical protein